MANNTDISTDTEAKKQAYAILRAVITRYEEGEHRFSRNSARPAQNAAGQATDPLGESAAKWSLPGAIRRAAQDICGEVETLPHVMALTMFHRRAMNQSFGGGSPGHTMARWAARQGYGGVLTALRQTLVEEFNDEN